MGSNPTGVDFFRSGQGWAAVQPDTELLAQQGKLRATDVSPLLQREAEQNANRGTRATQPSTGICVARYLHKKKSRRAGRQNNTGHFQLTFFVLRWADKDRWEGKGRKGGQGEGRERQGDGIG